VNPTHLLSSPFSTSLQDRSALSMQMTVSHMSGVGEDSVFMAVIIPAAPDRTTAKAWLLPSGHFMGVDSTFIDWLGYRPNELVGASITEVIKDPRALESVFNETKRPSKVSSSGSAVTPQASTPGPDSVLQRLASEVGAGKGRK
jgi:hypothetical protein